MQRRVPQGKVPRAIGLCWHAAPSTECGEGSQLMTSPWASRFKHARLARGHRKTGKATFTGIRTELSSDGMPKDRCARPSDDGKDGCSSKLQPDTSDSSCSATGQAQNDGRQMDLIDTWTIPCPCTFQGRNMFHCSSAHTFKAIGTWCRSCCKGQGLAHNKFRGNLTCNQENLKRLK